METKHFDDHKRSCLARPRKFAAAAWFLISIIVNIILLAPPSSFAVDNLIDHFIDGKPNKGHFPVFVFPDLYITYWGSAWQNGFSTNGIPSSQYQAYLESYLNSMCNSQWLLTQMQYRFAGCVPNRVVGTWIDSNNPPKQTPVNTDIYEEVKQSILHFQGVYPGDSNAITIIVLAPGFGDDAFAAKGGAGVRLAQHGRLSGLYRPPIPVRRAEGMPPVRCKPLSRRRLRPRRLRRGQFEHRP